MPSLISSDGSRISWELRGEGDPVLLIMGLGATRSAWEPHVAHLENSHRCVLMDNRGAGESDAPEGPYSIARMADDAAEVLREVGAGAARVIGISMGGAIAQQLALRHPSLVDRLILTSSWAGMNPLSEDVFAELRELKHTLSPVAFHRRLQLLIWSPPAYTDRVGELRVERGGVIGEEMRAAAFAAQVDACISHDARDQLARLDVPVLVTYGEMDVFTPAAAGQELARLIPNAAVEVFPGGHAHHWEELDRYNHICEEFLR